MQVLVVPVDDELYAIPLESVREVMVKPPSTLLPTAAEPVLGLINVRGEIVPLFDVSRLLTEGPTRRCDFAIVVEVAAGSAGLAASAAPVSETLGERVQDSQHAAGRGIYRQGNRLATLLDVEKLLSVAD